MNKLEWDSKFFGIQIASSTFDLIDKQILDRLMSKLLEEQIDLCYLNTSHPIPDDIIKNYPINYSNSKILFTKKLISTNEDTSTYIRSLPSSSIPDTCINISRQTGHHSRFKNDQKLPQGSYEKLYDEWITQSIRRTISDEVLVFESKKNIEGLITLKKKDASVVIGLLGVDELSRGKKIGQSLIKEAENYTIQCGINILDVSTQGSNRAAVRFYEKAGFVRKNTTFIYHLWPNYHH